MIAAYEADGSKDWITANITIDVHAAPFSLRTSTQTKVATRRRG